MTHDDDDDPRPQAPIHEPPPWPLPAKLVALALPPVAALAAAQGSVVPEGAVVALAAGCAYAVAAWQVLFRRNTAYEKAGVAIGATGLALVLLAFARVRPTSVLVAFGMALPVIAILVANWPRLAGRHVAQALTVLCVLALLFPGTCFMVFQDAHFHP